MELLRSIKAIEKQLLYLALSSRLARPSRRRQNIENCFKLKVSVDAKTQILETVQRAIISVAGIRNHVS